MSRIYEALKRAELDRVAQGHSPKSVYTSIFASSAPSFSVAQNVSCTSGGARDNQANHGGVAGGPNQSEYV